MKKICILMFSALLCACHISGTNNVEKTTEKNKRFDDPYYWPPSDDDVRQGVTPETMGLIVGDLIAVYYIDTWLSCRIIQMSKYGTMVVYNKEQRLHIMYRPNVRPLSATKIDSLNNASKKMN